MEHELTHDQVLAEIERLEAERATIYADSQVDSSESQRLHEIEQRLGKLWDERRRLEGASHAGLEAAEEPVADDPLDPPGYPEDGSSPPPELERA